jgi:hypothetical protein
MALANSVVHVNTLEDNKKRRGTPESSALCFTHSKVRRTPFYRLQ